MSVCYCLITSFLSLYIYTFRKLHALMERVQRVLPEIDDDRHSLELLPVGDPSSRII